jgi:hypothetical protein
LGALTSCVPDRAGCLLRVADVPAIDSLARATLESVLIFVYEQRLTELLHENPVELDAYGGIGRVIDVARQPGQPQSRARRVPPRTAERLSRR